MSVKPCSSSRSLRSIHVLLGLDLSAGSSSFASVPQPGFLEIPRSVALRPALARRFALGPPKKTADYISVIDRRRMGS